ncbi:adventurous gliding motility protein AgmC [Corallococcus silvisoli]|uniref:adventurous gliding motility protein AgmC n=1 Tax=Corallococcus silvisoli TaxID=2697031 RepID=UPI001377B3D1|nr:hypothetical protein [Corallococcus silvisoli]NBD09902.1 hypothetical protein [Corallococcus silvisoli]
MRIPLALIVGLLLAQVARAEPDSFGLGTGRDGVLALTPGQGVTLGESAPLGKSVDEGAKELSASGLKISAGDLLMIHQSTGLPTVPDVGSTTALLLATRSDPSHWELARVAGVSAGLITLTAPLRHSYITGRAQVLRVPEYSDVVVPEGARLTASPWTGKSGGILAMLVSGKVVNNGSIDADGAGFPGGGFAVGTVGQKACTGLELTKSAGGSMRGEGVAGVASQKGLITGRGNLANGGGGGNCDAAGGGGGGHGGVGGNGGDTSAGDGPRVEGGQGGTALNYLIFDRFMFGGGGGSGQGAESTGSSGGAGGGVVFIRATAFEGKGLFSASGAAAAASLGYAGAGGGGGGGVVTLRAVESVSCGALVAAGGAGGDAKLDKVPQGPGGGGAGGRVLVQGKQLDCAPSVNAGSPGTSSYPGAGSHGAGPVSTGEGPSAGTVQVLDYAFQLPSTPTITAPVSGTASTTTRPRFEGIAGTNGPVVHIVVDGREIGASVPGTDGRFVLNTPSPLAAGEHVAVAWAEGFGVASPGSDPVRFSSSPVVLADGGVVQMAVLVVPSNGDTVSPTPLFAGTTSNGVTVGVVIDDGPDRVVPVDLLGRFRYQVPASAPLAVGVHKVTVHAHNEKGEDGLYSDAVGFEVVVPGADGGTEGGSDAGSVDPAVPLMVVPAQDASVDPTFTFVGVALPGTSVRVVLDGTALATVTADDEGVFRHEVGADKALASGAHQVVAQVVTAEGEAGLRSPEVGFQVRGPTNLDVGCGCGTAPAGMLALWALVGLAVLTRRRARG